MKYKLIIFIFLFFVGYLLPVASFKIAPQNSGPPPKSLVGMNLSMVADWSTEIPFIDGFKASRPWLTQCLPTEADCEHPWDTGEEAQLNLDAQGWVKSLPLPEDKEIYTRVATLLLREVEPYPGGRYIVLYEGEGTIEYHFDAVKDIAASRLGRDVIEVTPSAQGIYLIITATDPHQTGNYLRHIRVIPEAREKTYQQDIFNPKFLEKIRPFQAIRFMDWMRTNNSLQQSWQNRPQLNQASYGSKLGVPLEILIKLANRLQVSPWFNIPHQADDEYILKFARLVKETLDPKLTLYLEYSNEVWNPQFQQFQWVRDQGAIKNQKTPYQSYGVRTAQMCQIWKDVFAARKGQVQCVMATQTANPWVAKQILNCPDWQEAPCYQHGIDLLAITGYFSGDLGKQKNYGLVKSWLQTSKVDAFGLALEQLRNGQVFPTKDSVKDTVERFDEYQATARDYGLKLVVYEGGSHGVGVQGVEQDQRVTDFFIELHRRPEFYALYQELLQGWQDDSGQRTLFMHYSDISRPSKWGSWGALEHVEQPTSPRYQALIDFMAEEK